MDFALHPIPSLISLAEDKFLLTILFEYICRLILKSFDSLQEKFARFQNSTPFPTWVWRWLVRAFHRNIILTQFFSFQDPDTMFEDELNSQGGPGQQKMTSTVVGMVTGSSTWSRRSLRDQNPKKMYEEVRTTDFKMISLKQTP